MRRAKPFVIVLLPFCLATSQAAWREPVRAAHGMVASTERVASQIGVSDLQGVMIEEKTNMRLGERRAAGRRSGRLLNKKRETRISEFVLRAS